jgi:hypothetical protein
MGKAGRSFGASIIDEHLLLVKMFICLCGFMYNKREDEACLLHLYDAWYIRITIRTLCVYIEDKNRSKN